jgi:hypothetical protein
MSDFPTVLTNAIDGAPGTGTPILAKHLNNLEAKVGVDNSADSASLDWIARHALIPINGIYANLGTDPNTELGYGTWLALGLSRFERPVVLLRFEGTTTTIVNDGRTGTYSFQCTGSATQSTSQHKFGAKSLSCPNTSSYLQPVSSTMNFADMLLAGTFTFHFWLYPTSFASLSYLFDWDGLNTLFQIAATTGVIGFQMDALAQTFGTLSLNSWQHVCLKASGGVLKVAINGTYHANTFNIGSRTVTSLGAIFENYVGYVDEFIADDQDIYPSNFTPPTITFPLAYRWLRTA